MFRIKTKLAASVLFVFVISVSYALAQGPGSHGPRIFGGWEPKVGAGAAYRMEAKTKKGKEVHDWEWAVVGSEKVGADMGYWLEMYGQERGGESVVMKQLIVWRQEGSDIKRMIMQAGNEEPMEVPVGMMAGGKEQPGQKDVRKTGKRIGTESVTTPAGTFACEHWQDTEQGGTYDVWLAKDVPPFGIVKATSPDTTMTLMRVITNAESRIKGQPRSMEEMMRGTRR